MPEPERKRRRPAVSCTVCRKRKIKCNREFPCNNCLKSRDSICTYDSFPRETFGRGKVPGLGTAAPSGVSSTTSKYSTSSQASATESSTTSTWNTELTGAITSTSEAPNKPRNNASVVNSSSIRSPASTATEYIETTTTSLGGTFHVHNESHAVGRSQAITRRVTHKTRSFGQSHWINAVTLLTSLFDNLEPHLRDESSAIVPRIQQCKSLARAIKSRRAPSWPTIPTTELPTKELADELLQCYLRTTETFYRVVHIPTFNRDYEALWTSDRQSNRAFIVQVKLILAIGAATYDDGFSLRSSAIRWIYEASTWLAEPSFKSRLNVQSLQTNILLLIAQETVDVGADATWICAGTLLRRAMQMGFHRDPSNSPNVPLFAAEIRRRLWNTILEICLQSSLVSGGPPLICMDDFDTEPPSNYDDSEISAQNPLLEPESESTQTSIAIALRKTFPSRLAIVKFLNDINQTSTYEDTLRLDTDIRASYKTLCQSLQTFMSGPHPPLRFSIQVVDFLMHRYIVSLHVPFFAAARTDTALAFSRNVVIESSLKIWHAIRPSPYDPSSPAQHNDLARLTTSGSVLHRHGVTQATLLIAIELITQLQHSSSLSPPILRPDLLSVVSEVKEWCIHCINAGETSMKGHLIASLVGAKIEALRRGIGEEEGAKMLIGAATESIDRCLPLLEEMAERARGIEGLEGISLDAVDGGLGNDWNFLMDDSMLKVGDATSMEWMFNDGVTQGFSLW